MTFPFAQIVSFSVRWSFGDGDNEMRKDAIFGTAAFLTSALACGGYEWGMLTRFGQQVTAGIALVLWVLFAIEAARH